MNDQRTIYETCPKHGRYVLAYDNNGTQLFVADCPACIAERKDQRIFQSASIPLRFMGKTLDGYEPKNPSQTAAKRFVGAFIEGLSTNLHNGVSAILYGNFGTGKSHLASVVCIEAIKRGRTARFTTVSNLIKTVRSTWGGEGSELDAIRAFQTVDFLVIDEIGVQACSESEALILTDVLNGRYENIKSTFLLSNLNLEGIEKVITPRCLDRLRENGGKAIRFEGESFRRSNR